MPRPVPLPRIARADVLLAAGWIVVIALVASSTVTDTDPYWQVRAGRELLDGVPLVHADTWSWSPVAGPFYPNSPAWNVALALAWGAASSWGLFAISVLAVSGALAMVTWLAVQLGARLLPTIGVLLVTALVALPLLTPRPAVGAAVLMLLAIALAGHLARRRPEPLPGALLAFVVALGVSFAGNWIHLSWSTTALVVAAAWAAVWWLAPGLRTPTRLALTAAGTCGLLLGVALGPYGFGSWTRAGAVVEASAGVIEEWTSPFSVERNWYWAPVALAALLATLVSVGWCLRTASRRGRSDPRLALVAGLTVAALPFAAAGLLYARFVPTTILTLAPLAAVAASAAAVRLHDRVVAAGGRVDLVGAQFWRRILAITLVILAPVALIASSAHAEPTTAAANAALPSGCRLFSTPDEAASVILTRPDVTVWVDGRSDYWGRDRIREAQSYLYSPRHDAVVPPGTTCVLLPAPQTGRAPEALIDALDGDPRWRRAVESPEAIVWIPASVPS
jgi:hypothetical protein